jgi:hypothetical protein
VGRLAEAPRQLFLTLDSWLARRQVAALEDLLDWMELETPLNRMQLYRLASLAADMHVTQVRVLLYSGGKVANRNVWEIAHAADFPLHDCSPYSPVHVRRESSGFVHRSRTRFCRPVPNPAAPLPISTKEPLNSAFLRREVLQHLTCSSLSHSFPRSPGCSSALLPARTRGCGAVAAQVVNTRKGIHVLFPKSALPHR